MKNSRLLGAVCACIACIATTNVSAAHIDELGINISLNSSDGAGNFVLKYEEYFGSDGWMWQNSGSELNTWGYASGGYVTNYLSGVPNLLTITGASTTLQSGTEIFFEGLVDSIATPTVGFGVGQVNTQFVNGTTDAALYSGLFGFSITGYDPDLAYTINISANDCCYVSGGGGPSFNDAIIFDPSVVVEAVPIPATVWLFGSGLLGLVGMARRKKA